MPFADALDADSQLLVIGFLERDLLDAVQLTCRHLCDFVEGSTSLPLRRLDCMQIEGSDPADGNPRHSLVVGRNGEREVMEADSLRVAASHFFAYLRNSYCAETDIMVTELSSGFVNRLVAMRTRFRTSSFRMRPVHFVDVAPVDLQRLVACMCPGLSHFQCTSDNITPAHVTDQLLDSLTSNGVNSAFFRSLDKAVYFNVSDEAIARFCFGTFDAKRYLMIQNVRVTQPLLDRLIQAHRDSNNPMQLSLDDPNMPEIDGTKHADCIVTRDAQKTTYKFTTTAWTTTASVHKSGYLSMSRVERGDVRYWQRMAPSEAVLTKKRRIV